MSHEHDIELETLRETLAKHCVFSAVLRRSKRIGAVEIGIPVEHDPERPGFSSLDVDGFYRLNLFYPKDLWCYLTNIYGWIKDSVELRSWGFFVDCCPLLFPWQQWTWTFSSFRDLRWEVASKIAEEMVARQKITEHRRMIELEADYEIKIVGQVTNDDVRVWLKHETDCVRCSQAIWVEPHDPTVFHVDDDQFAYDMSHGWSEEKVCELIAKWFWCMGYARPIVRARNRFSQYNPWLTKVKKSISKCKFWNNGNNTEVKND